MSQKHTTDLTALRAVDTVWHHCKRMIIFCSPSLLCKTAIISSKPVVEMTKMMLGAFEIWLQAMAGD